MPTCGKQGTSGLELKDSALHGKSVLKRSTSEVAWWQVAFPSCTELTFSELQLEAFLLVELRCSDPASPQEAEGVRVVPYVDVRMG
jgi:hypothetical protein